MKAIHFSTGQLEQLAQVTPLDIEAARQLWARAVPLRWKRLLESQTLGVDPVLTTPFVWDAQNRRYIHLASRRYVPFAEIREQAIEPLIVSSRLAQRALSSSLQSRDSSLVEWQRAMIEQIKQTQVAAALAAGGGESNNSQADWKKIAALILLYLLLFRDFALEIETGRQALNGLLLVRSDLYANSARDLYEETRRHGLMVYFGAVQEMRILGRAEHCHTDGDLVGCVELHDLGWAPIGSLPRLGQTPCRTNCKCHWIYRYKNEQGDWVIVDDRATIAAILKQFHVEERSDE